MFAKVLPFVVWTWIGIIAWRMNVMLPGDHRRLRAWAFALGLAGAWAGGFIAATLVHGSFFAMDWRTVTGCLVGATVQLVAFDFVARAIVREHDAAEDRARRERTRRFASEYLH